MMVAPGAGRVELANPEPAFGVARGGFLASVIVCGNGEARLHHLHTQIAPAGATTCQNAAKSIVTIRPALQRFSSYQGYQTVAGGAATGPIIAVGVATDLVQFGGVNTQQAHAIATKMEAVPIADPGAARHRRPDRFEACRKHRASRQDHNGQYRAEPAAKGTPLIEV